MYFPWMPANYIMVFSRNCNNQHGEISVRKSCSYMLTLPQSVLNSAVSRPLDKGVGVGEVGGEARSPKKIFSALRASVWTKNKCVCGGEPLPWIRQ